MTLAKAKGLDGRTKDGTDDLPGTDFVLVLSDSIDGFKQTTPNTFSASMAVGAFPGCDIFGLPNGRDVIVASSGVNSLQETYSISPFFSRAMDTVLGVTYDGGVIIAADQSNGRSILTYQTNLDKIAKLTSHSMMGVSGPNCDLVKFTEYISKNINLYELSNAGTKLSTHAQANYARGEMAAALRKGPYQVNVLLGGFDEKDGGSLYHLDYMGTLHKVKHGAQGYAQYFCSSIYDKDWSEGLTEEEAVKIIEKCINEVHTRFLMSQPNFIIKKVDKDGVKVISFGSDPSDT